MIGRNGEILNAKENIFLSKKNKKALFWYDQFFKGQGYAAKIYGGKKALDLLYLSQNLKMKATGIFFNPIAPISLS